MHIENNIDKSMENALKSNDIQKIMSRACRSFSRELDSDEIYTCKINALWKCLKNFNPDKKAKFTTYLYQGVYIECLKELKFKNKSRKNKCKLHDNLPKLNSDILLVDILDELKNPEDRDLIVDKMSNMTIEEMANKRPYSRETVRKKLKKITDTLKTKFN